MDPEAIALAIRYREAGLTWTYIAEVTGVSRTTLKKYTVEGYRDATPDPNVAVYRAKWRCQCSRINSGPDACRCGRRAYWAAQDEVTRELERQLEEEVQCTRHD